MQRFVQVVAVALAACSHPAQPPRAPEPDDEWTGAVELVWDDITQNFAAEGALDARAGDTVDWYTLALPPGEKSSFTVYVDGLGRAAKLPMTIGVADESTHIVGNVDVESDGYRDSARQSGFVASGRLYVRLEATPGSALSAYRIAVQNVYQLPPPGPPPCDPYHWDASNPTCEHVCNRKDPDLRSVACCDLMRPCSRGVAVMPCVGGVIAYADEIFTASIGRDDAGIEFLPAYLPVPGDEPPVFSPGGKVISVSDHRHQLMLVSADAHTSTWRLMDPSGHDLVWLGANAKRIEIPPMPVCRGGDVVVPRR